MASYIDQFSAESLLVIKKPPVEAPTIVPFRTNGENNFLEERFIWDCDTGSEIDILQV